MILFAASAAIVAGQRRAALGARQQLTASVHERFTPNS
jgi:hypothetical protein